MAKNHYCDTKVLEEWWAGWLATSVFTVELVFNDDGEPIYNKRGNQKENLTFVTEGDDRNWDKMTEMLYSICVGISKKFRPRDEEELNNLANEAIVKLMHKITTGRLRYTPTCQGGSPIFNLVTTTVQNILCSYKNKVRDSKVRHSKYVLKEVQSKAPELMSSVKNLYQGS